MLSYQNVSIRVQYVGAAHLEAFRLGNSLVMVIGDGVVTLSIGMAGLQAVMAEYWKISRGMYIL